MPQTPTQEKRPLTPLMQEILSLRGEGKSPAVIAKELHRTPGTVKTLLWQLRRRGFELPPITQPELPLPVLLLTERQQDILHLADGTRTIVEIERELGIANCAVHHTLTQLRRYGFDPQTRDGRRIAAKVKKAAKARFLQEKNDAETGKKRP